MSTLSERIARDPEPWKPNAGDVIEGVVLDVDSRESDYSGTYPVLSLETDDGTEYTVHAFHAVLAGEVRRKDPKPGDRVAVRFVGEKVKADGKPFFQYRLAIERAERPAETVPAIPDPFRLQRSRIDNPHPGEESF